MKLPKGVVSIDVKMASIGFTTNDVQAASNAKLTLVNELIKAGLVTLQFGEPVSVLTIHVAHPDSLCLRVQDVMNATQAPTGKPVQTALPHPLAS